MKLKHNRYWVFAFDKDKPKGGFLDYKFAFNNVEEYEERILELDKYEFHTYQVLDTNNRFHFEGDLGTVTKWVCKNIGDEGYDEIL